MEADIPTMVERPIARAGMREDESRAAALVEDAVEFAQNIGRVLESGDLQGILMTDMPVVPEQHLHELQAMLREAIERRDWDAARKIGDTLDDETTSSLHDAREYGIALGTVLEQLRGGLLEIVRLRNAGMTRHDRSVADTIAELRALGALKDPVKESRTRSQAAD
jgi:hypothetical protein